MKRTAARVLRAGLLEALLSSEKHMEMLEHVEYKTDLVATMIEELRDKLKETEDGKSSSVH
jgi:hypothetical protein